MSAYHSAPGVTSVKIDPYPKRRSHGSFPRERDRVTLAESLRERPRPQRRYAAEPCYADFFAQADAGLLVPAVSA